MKKIFILLCNEMARDRKYTSSIKSAYFLYNMAMNDIENINVMSFNTFRKHFIKNNLLYQAAGASEVSSEVPEDAYGVGIRAVDDFNL